MGVPVIKIVLLIVLLTLASCAQEPLNHKALNKTPIIVDCRHIQGANKIVQVDGKTLLVYDEDLDIKKRCPNGSSRTRTND